MPPAYKRLDRDECAFLFVDHQVSLCEVCDKQEVDEN